MTRRGKLHAPWLAALVIAVGLYGLAAAGPQRKARRATRARSIFQQTCARCHGADGRGRTAFGEKAGAPDFTAAWWQEVADDERLTASITRGRGRMPAFGRKLSRHEIKSLVAFVRRFKR